MKDEKHSHKNANAGSADDGFFSRVEIPYEKDREEVWDMLQSKLAERPAGKVRRMHKRVMLMALAASVLILLGWAGFMRYYTETVATPAGIHQTAQLPDGSTVELNAESSIRFHPYWWRFSRSVALEGEGFFRITKGRRLEVLSKNGKTVVLGTSFNIFARGERYKVTCMTGRVKVVSVTEKEVILTPDYHAEIDAEGNITVKKLDKPEVTNQWMHNMFSFTATPFAEVIAEVERQYGIIVGTNKNFNYKYTGYFSRNKPVEQVLDLLCKPFGLTFVRKSAKEYLIVQK